MTKPRFIHLHVHSDYSMIDGLIKINLLIQTAANLQMPALAITDFTNLCGLIKFYKYAYKAGIKPIVGADFLVRSEITGNALTNLTLLAANKSGYQNLILLISQAYKYGYNDLGPVINHDWLIKYNKGLILLSGGCKGDIGRYLICGNIPKVEQCVAFYKRYFPNRYYLELIRTGRRDEENYLRAAVELSAYKGLPIVASNDVRFISSKDFDVHEIRVAIHNKFTIDDPKRPNNYSSQQFMRSEQEMCDLFSDFPEALINSVEIARRCNVSINFGEYFLPKFPTGKMSTEDYLIMCARRGLEEKLIFLFPKIEERHKKRSHYEQRLATELQVINQMGFPGYFLIVMEFIQWAKDNNIPVGPGRGSGAGSLVAYVLKITDLDPLTFNLLFERFLNPERTSMPDFDIDFCMEKRDLVINHVANNYGSDAVSQIIAFGTMTAKSVIRDVGRVLGYPYKFVDHISKLVPFDPGITLDQILTTKNQLQKIYNTDEEVKILIDMARKLEGITKNASKHAGGVVIAPTKITDFTPIYCDSNGNNQVTQFDKTDVEYIGLVKFDFLGLRTLTIINWALKMINKQRNYQQLPSIDISSIPLNDKKSFNILQQSETNAIFQLESKGMKDLIKRLQPDCFEDIIALIALFRPGPLKSGMVDNFINRKHGREIISYPDIEWQHKSLKLILEPTYGIILYQEQVMQIAQILAGYTLGEADILRRSMGHKKPKEMAKQRAIFKKGSERHGINSELAMKIFDLVEKFAGYGFNKSHSAAYAMISYQTLWLKTHYPAEFMAATMSADMDNTKRIVSLIDECKRIGLKVLPPNINNGKYYFHVNKIGEIVYGIGAIKGLGEKLIEEIIKIRNQNSCFYDLFDFCIRTANKKINRRILEKLIMSGAFDCFKINRAALIYSLDNVLKAVNQHINTKLIGQKDMFGIPAQREMLSCNDTSSVWSKQLILEKEREALGFYLSDHPILQYVKEIKYYNGGISLKDISHHLSSDRHKIFTVVGLVVSTRLIFTKHGNNVGLCTLNDHSGYLDVILFTDVLKKYKKLFKKDYILIIQGRINYYDNNIKMIANKLMDINEARK